MSFKSKGPKSHPNHSPKANPEPPKPTPEKEAKLPNQKPNQTPNQKPKSKTSEETKNSIHLSTPDMNKDTKNTINNLTSQPNKEPNKPITKSHLKPNKESKNRITQPNFKPNPNNGSKNIISRLIFDPNKASPNKNKINRPKLDPNVGVKNKIVKYKIEATEKPKNGITGPTIHPNQKPKNKITRSTFDPSQKAKNRIPNSRDSHITKTKNEPQISTIKIIPNQTKSLNLGNNRYSEKDVRNWITYYKKFRNYKIVLNKLREDGQKIPGITTMRSRIKKLIGAENYKDLMKKYTFSDLKGIVKQVGIDKTGATGKILSIPQEFKGVKSKLLYQCGKCNHLWKTTVDSIINNKSWCPKCAAKNRVDNRRGSVEEHQKIIEEKGGKLKGFIYEDTKERLFNNKTSFKIECEAGHKFSINAHDLKQGKWCRKCNYEIIGEKLRGSFQDIQNLIEKRGGQCISKPKDYKNQHQKLKIQCNKEHIFEKSPTNLKSGGWCPVCSQGRFETICRGFFEELFQNEFPKERPNWLVNSRGNQMELDGYNKSLDVAFEAQGEQHYHLVPYFHKTLKDFEQRIEDDLKKLELCKLNNVTLIRIPYYVHPNNIQRYITNKYERLSNKKMPEIPKIDYNKFYDTKDDQKKMDNYL